jgi:hypothetical protein
MNAAKFLIFTKIQFTGRRLVGSGFRNQAMSQACAFSSPSLKAGERYLTSTIGVGRAATAASRSPLSLPYRFVQQSANLSFNSFLNKLFLHVKCFTNITPPLAVENGNGQRLPVRNR